MSTLRTIAIHVKEPDPGAFTWVLTERDGAEWVEVGRADATAGTYRQAMADGLLALQSMVDDLDIGPRTRKAGAAPKRGKAAPGRTGIGTDADTGSDADADADAAPADAAAKNKAFFGFGPAR
jgi:hypothetical protein